VQRVDYGSGLGDMLGLSRSRLLIASGSTFSMWGRYLGQVPTIWHPGKLLQHVLIAQPEREIEWAEGESLPGWVGSALYDRTLFGNRAPMIANEVRSYNVAGFSLHAGTVCEAFQRSRLERLCRYITRPPVATQRLSQDARGRVVYRYKQPFRDGSTHVVLEPLDFIARLAGICH
jgi:hypothetical protein